MGSQAGKTVYLGRFVSTPTPEQIQIRTGAVLVSKAGGQGVIEKTNWDHGLDDQLVDGAQISEDVKKEVLERFGLSQTEPSGLDIVVCKANGFFFPGFVDTHIHAPQYPNSGIFGKSTLLDWLETYTFPLESSLGSSESPMYKPSRSANQASTNGAKGEKIDPLARAGAVYERVVGRTLAYGTTTASYYATLHVPTTNALADITFRRGQRAFIGRVCMDHPATCPEYYRDEGPEETMRNTHAVVEHISQLDPKGKLTAPIITPRFAPSCQPETLTLLGQLAKEKGLRVQTHISENVGELELVKSLFPEQESYTKVYDEHGLLTEKTILAHAIHLSDDEIALIVERKSKVSHCPASNSALGSGFCLVRKLVEQGVDVGLGTDVSGGYSASILEAVRQACLVSRHVGFVNGGDKKWNIGVAEGLYLGTLGGAKVVGLEGKLGGFEEGMYWDVQEIELGQVPEFDQESEPSTGPESVDIFGWETWEERIDKWVWNGDDRNVRRVWVSGRLVHERA